MTDELWTPTNSEAERITSNGRPSDADLEYAKTFAAVARTLDNCQRSEDVTLLLSTCRNEFLTTNSVFLDLRECLGVGRTRESGFSVLSDAIRHLNKSSLSESAEYVGTRLRQARKKLRVWDDHSELLLEYHEATKALRPLERGLAARVIEQTNSEIPGADIHYTAISGEEGKCLPELKVLRVVTTRLSAAFEILLVVSKMGIRSSSSTPSDDALFNVDPPLVEWTGVIDALSSRMDVWHLRAIEGGVEVVPTDLVSRMDGSAISSITLMRRSVNSSDDDRQLARILSMIDAVVSDCRLRLEKAFRPNVASRPMPSVFVVDLTVRHSDDVAELDDLRVLTPVILPEVDSLDTCVIGAMQVVMPRTWYFGEDEVRYNRSIAEVDRIEAVISEALEKGADQGMRCLILPEAFVPLKSLETVYERANALKIDIIAGVEGELDSEGHATNRCVMHFPGSKRYWQSKIRPSVYEEAPDRFSRARDLVVVRDTNLGNLGVIVCSDFLEADVLSRLAIRDRHRLDTLVVCASNPRTELFETLAKADAVRYYAHVVVVNSVLCDAENLSREHGDGGCLVAAPTGDGLVARRPVALDLGTLGHEGPNPKLLLWDLDIGAIKTRSKRRPARRGWLTPSLFAQQVRRS